MKSGRINGLIILVFFSFGVWGQDTLYLQTYLNQYGDFSMATNRALEACKEVDRPVLVIPPGEHHYFPDAARQLEVKMTNNINGRKRIAFPIVDQHDLTILGQHASIILHGTMMGMIVHGSQRITVKGLSFDWAVPFYLQGRVISVDRSSASYVLEIMEGEQFSILNNDLRVERATGNYFIGGNYWFAPETRAPVYLLERRKGRHWNPYRGENYRLERLDDRKIRVTNRLDSLPQPGWHFIAKWRNQPNVNRIAPALHLQESRELKLDNVSIHSAAGMGLIAERCENVHLFEVRVTPTPETHRVISTTADATHFVNCRGLIKLERCFFEACLDDGINIHGNYATLRRVLNDSTLLGEIVHVQQQGFVFAGAGDSIRFIDPASLLPVGTKVRTKAIELLNDQFFLLHLADSRPLNKILTSGMGMENISWVADLEMRDCTVQRNWARGILFKTAGRVLIERNTLSPSMSGLRNWGEMKFFNESGSVTEVIIRQNMLLDPARVANGQPAVVIYPQIADTASLGVRGWYNRNILLEENTIATFDPALLFAQSVDGLTFARNLLQQTTTYPIIFPDKPGLQFRGVRNLRITENSYRGAGLLDIWLDQLTGQSLHLGKNEGFSAPIIH